MVSHRRRHTILTVIGLYIFAAAFIGYFGVNAFTGNHGLRAQADLDQQLSAMQQELKGLKAFDLELQQCSPLGQRGSHLEAVPAIYCMIGEVGREPQAEKQHRSLPRPRAPIMIWLTQHYGYAAQNWWTRVLCHAHLNRR